MAAVSIPLIIEWLFRKRKRQVELPTIRFLLRNKEQEKIRRQDRLLLLLRMFALFLLVLALTRPLLRRGQEERHVVVLLDGTASMHQLVGTTDAFGIAQREAATIVRDLPKDGTAAVGFLGDGVETLVEKGEDVHTAAGKIEAKRAGSGAAPMAEGLAWIKKHATEPDSEIYIFSDFQKSTWLHQATTSAEVSGKLNGIAAGNKVYLVDAGADAKFNLMVTRLRPQEWVMSARMPVTFMATVECTGEPPKDTTATVTFLVNDAKKGHDEIEIGKEPVGLRFDYTFPKAGEYKVELVVEGNKLPHPIDNRRLYIAKVPEDVGVLILDETAGSPTADSIYLARAVAPPWRPGMPKVSRFATKTVHPAQILRENLTRDYIAVVLIGSDFLRDDIVKKLERYVGDGGALWLFMGPRVNLRDYNRLLYCDGKGLMPCRLKAKVTVQRLATAKDKDVYPRFGESAWAPTARLSAGPPNEDAGVSRIIELETKPGADSRVKVRLSNGVPCVVEQDYGSGKVLVVNFTAGTEWTYLPTRPEFGILAQEILRYLVGNPDKAVNLEVGQPFRQPVFVSPQYLLLYYPDQSRVPVRPERRTDVKDAWLINFRDTNQQGLYQFKEVQPEFLARRSFVVNQSAAEGDLAHLDRASFDEAIGLGACEWVGPRTSLADKVTELHAKTRLAPWILWALAAALALESFLAVRFGRRRGGAPT